MLPDKKKTILRHNRRKLFLRALLDSLIKLNPRIQLRNPVMFVVFMCAIASLLITFYDRGRFNFQITLWLWFTVLFANFAESLAEGRGKAQADALKKSRKDTMARRLRGKKEELVSAKALHVDDIVICSAGDIIPADGDVIEGIASVDESAITGESAPVIRESGGDRCAVTGGTKIISDHIVVRVTSEPGNTFLDRMITLVEGAKRKATPNEIALNILLVSLTIIFALAVATLLPFTLYSEAAGEMVGKTHASPMILIALLVCLIPTTIGGLLSAIGISGIDRLIRKNVIALSGKAVEAAGDIDVLLLDKTGTITLGNRVATAFKPGPQVDPYEFAAAAQLASLADETPEGRSIVIYAKEKYGLRGEKFTDSNGRLVPFTAAARMSGIDFLDKEDLLVKSVRKGAIDAIRKFVEKKSGSMPRDIEDIATAAAKAGATPLAVAVDQKVLGVIILSDMVKGGIKERFAQMRRMGIKTVMITGDNPLTAASIAAEAGVDDFIAEATPEAKLRRLRDEQAKGHLVGMIGDGTNDAPALAQADVGVAMNSGTQAAREAGNMVDLDSNPTKLIEIVETGKQLLMTRGSLTTFSIANDIAKYFVILPAMFASLYAPYGQSGPLAALNLMKLSSPESAILSAVIFNALIIIALVPLALRGVRYRPLGAEALLRRNLLIYGMGGIIVPFLGIKLIDMGLLAMHLI